MWNPHTCLGLLLEKLLDSFDNRLIRVQKRSQNCRGQVGLSFSLVGLNLDEGFGLGGQGGCNFSRNS